MATIKPYETAAGKRYRVRYRKPDGTQTDKRGFKTKREAEHFSASVTVAKATGDYIDPQLGRVTVGQLADAWLTGKKAALKPSSYRPLESGWKTHIEAKWGAREVKSIQPSEVQTWTAELANDRSATTVQRALGILAGILEHAVTDRRISRNPARGIKTKRKTPKPRIYLTHAQVQALAEASAHPALVLTLAYTGLRWGEATALRVRSMNEVRRRLHVEENAVMAGSILHIGTPKTDEKRSVPYPAFLSKLLAVEAHGKRPEQILFGDGDTHMRLPNSVDGWFASAVNKVREAQTKAREDATPAERKLLPPVMPRVTPHDLRHTAASLAISSGANVKAVQHMLGHASAAMTLDTYADLFDDDLDAVAAKLDEVAAELLVGKAWANPKIA